MPVYTGGPSDPDFSVFSFPNYWTNWYLDRTEIQCKALGMKVEVWDEFGNNIESTGQTGELVCTRPHISLPVGFWGDTADGKKFRETYYDMYPGK